MQPSLKDIVFLVFRYKFALGLFSVLLCIVLGLYLAGAKKVYESRAEVLVRFGQEQLGSMTLSSTARNVYFARREEEIQNELRILTSNDSFTAVAARIAGPQAADKRILEVREYLARNLFAKSVKNSDMIAVSFCFPDPFVAQKLLETILEQYRKHHGEVYFDDDEQRLLQAALEQAKAEYAAALNALSAFESEHHVFDDRQLVLLNETRENQQLALNALTNEYAYTRRKRDQLREVLADLPQQVLFSSREVLNERHAKIAERLSQAYVDRENLARRYTPDSRALKDVEKEIGLLNQLLKKEPQRHVDDKEKRRSEVWEALNRQLLELTPEVEAQLARIESMRRQVAEIDDALARAGMVKGEYSLMVRDVELKKAVYDKYYQDFTEAAGRTSARRHSITNVAVIESPSFSPLPIKPESKKIVALGIALFIVGNATLLVLSLALDKTVAMPLQAQKAFQLPVLGVFSRSEAECPDKESSSSFFEVQKGELRKLYLKLVSSEGQCRSVLFASADKDGQDVSPAEAFAAFSLRYQQKSTVFVRYVSGSERASGPEPGAPRIGPAGLHVYERSAAVGSEERVFWDWLQESYALLVFECSPLQESALLIAFADYVDKVLFTVQAERSNKFVVNHTLGVMRQYGLEAMGLVLNGRRLHIPQAVYRRL